MSHTRVNADLLVMSYTLEGEEEARIAPEGTVAYRKRWQENGKPHEVEGRLEGETFRCVAKGSDAGNHTVSIPRGSYDATTMDCPELRLKAEGERMTLRLLDLEACEVLPRTYRWVRSERAMVSRVNDLFRVIEFRDRNKSGTRWILPDSVGVRIARQDGESSKGSYSVRTENPVR